MSAEILKPGGDPAFEPKKELEPVPAMKPIVEKVLSSGLIDKATAELMEVWGYLPGGASSKVNEDALKNATQEKVSGLAKELANELEKEHHLRETYLDLERVRWPALVRLDIPSNMVAKKDTIMPIAHLAGVVDRMGRYYFRLQDVNPDWFVPGFIITQSTAAGEQKQERIYQSQVLYIGEQGVCVQVSVEPLKPE
jgi:hypothetical protein